MSEIAALEAAAHYWGVITGIFLAVAAVVVGLYRIKQNAKAITDLHQGLYTEKGLLVYMPAQDLKEKFKELENKFDTSLTGLRHSLESEIIKICKKAESNQKKTEELETHMEEKMLSLDKHTDLCGIANLKMREFIQTQLKEAVKEISEVVNSNSSKVESMVQQQSIKVDKNTDDIRRIDKRTSSLADRGE